MKRGTLVGLRAGGATLCGVAAVAGAVGLLAGAAPSTAVDPAVDAAVVDPAVRFEPAPAPMMRASYTWTGNHPTSDDWNLTANWATSGGIGYPSSSADDATIDISAYPDLEASHTIDDLTLEPDGNLFFDASSNDRTLTCDTVTISGGSSAADVRVQNRAGIETD